MSHDTNYVTWHKSCYMTQIILHDTFKCHVTQYQVNWHNVISHNKMTCQMIQIMLHDTFVFWATRYHVIWHSVISYNKMTYLTTHFLVKWPNIMSYDTMSLHITKWHLRCHMTCFDTIPYVTYNVTMTVSSEWGEKNRLFACKVDFRPQ